VRQRVALAALVGVGERLRQRFAQRARNEERKQLRLKLGVGQRNSRRVGISKPQRDGTRDCIAERARVGVRGGAGFAAGERERRSDPQPRRVGLGRCERLARADSIRCSDGERRSLGVSRNSDARAERAGFDVRPRGCLGIGLRLDVGRAVGLAGSDRLRTESKCVGLAVARSDAHGMHLVDGVPHGIAARVAYGDCIAPGEHLGSEFGRRDGLAHGLSRLDGERVN
jgi:hypothetical protein